MTAAPERIGPYLVLEKLGEGGMGVVFLVQDPKAPRQLALKLIRDASASEIALERFWREAEALARIHHRNVVRVHQIGQLPEGTYLLMEPVEGQSLDRALRSGAMDVSESARIIRELADALAAVHGEGILHRDLKPGNVILQPDGIPVLLDFGLIRDESAERLTRTGATLGTLAYMSPEQTSGASTTLLGPQTDVYSLGVMLFELVTGARPFQDVAPAELVAHRLFDRAPAPSSMRADVPRAIDAICSHALAREPADRYPSAAALREDLDRFLAGRPPAALERLKSSQRGAKRALALLSALGLGLVIVIAAVVAPRLQTDPAELEARAERLAKKARRVLADPAPLAARAAAVDALAAELSDLETALAPELQRSTGYRQPVVALQGLLALTQGSAAKAREALATIEPSRQPPACALRGGLAAVTTASDAIAAVRDLTHALTRGVRAAELLGWRAQARVRAGLTPRTSEEVLDDLNTLKAQRALTREERVLRVLALAGTKRGDAATAALKALPRPPPRAQWAVALLQVELVLEENPAAGLGFLALPEDASSHAERARLAKRAVELASPLATFVSERYDRSVEDKLLAYAQLIKRLLPDDELPEHLVANMVDASTRWNQGRFWSPSKALVLSRLIPTNAEHHLRLAMMALNLRSPGERRPMIPILRRAIELQGDPKVRHDLSVALCTALAQNDHLDECRELLPALLAHEGGEPILRADLLAVRAKARQDRGDLKGALADLDAARVFARHGRWTYIGFEYKRAKLLQAMGRNAEAAQDAAGFVEGTPQLNDEALQKDALIIAWTHGATGAHVSKVKKAIQLGIERRLLPAGWKVRLATLHLRAGDSARAVRLLRNAAPDLKGPAADLAEETTAIADAIESEGALALPKLEGLLSTLESLRGEGLGP